MNKSYIFFNTALRSTILSTILFNGAMFIMDEVFHPIAFIISFLILGFISSIMILATVCPFLILNISKSNSIIFRTYFPYYAIITLIGYLWILFNIGFYTDQCFIIGIAYFTGLQSWVWFFKPTKITL